MERQMLARTKLPDAPGVYRFVGARGEILYIGKATSLRNRVRSYFAKDIEDKRGPAIAQMVAESKTVRWEQTDSVLESLIREVNLIKKHQPKYNVKEKDDKSFNYIVITRKSPPAGGFPRVLLARGRQLPTTHYPLLATFGPFPRGGVLRDALKIIRKIFPFRDACKPKQGKPCFNAQIGLCPGVCSGAITQKDYQAIIKNLSLFLSGKKKTLVRNLKRDMRAAAQRKNFEEASQIKKTLFALTHIQDVALIKNTAGRSRTFDQYGSAMRIEAYDIAHIGGTAQVGVMTVVENGEPARGEYRKFRIKTVRGADDTASLAEVLTRRFGHAEWAYPRLIVADGGAAQKNRAEKTLRDMGVEIPVVSVVKDERHHPRAILGLEKIRPFGVSRPDLEKAILFANTEAHRFALAYHKKTRARNFL